MLVNLRRAEIESLVQALDAAPFPLDPLRWRLATVLAGEDARDPDLDEQTIRALPLDPEAVCDQVTTAVSRLAVWPTVVVALLREADHTLPHCASVGQAADAIHDLVEIRDHTIAALREAGIEVTMPTRAAQVRSALAALRRQIAANATAVDDRWRSEVARLRDAIRANRVAEAIERAESIVEHGLALQLVGGPS